MRLLEIRCQAYQQEVTALRQQVAQIDDLKAEIAELRERLGQTSCNSSRPPFSDPPPQKLKSASESKGRKRRRSARPSGEGAKTEAVG